MEKTKEKSGKILRQCLSNRIVHWVTAISIFMLIISGLGQLPLYARYNATKLPGAEWLGNYFSTLTLHYIGAVILLAIMFYHIVYHVLRKEFDIWPRRGDVKESFKIIKAMLTKGKEPPSDKYLAEQRLAYLFIGVSIVLLVVTGFIKILKNVPGIEVSYTIIFWSSLIHNLGTVMLIFGIGGHLAAFLIKENRALLPCMFSGYVCENYVKHRHSVWYQKLLKKQENHIEIEKKSNKESYKQGSTLDL